MSRRSNRFLKDTCYHGYAGLGSAFVAVADRMLKPNGRLAFVLPLSTAIGISWRKTRELINRHYHDLVVVSISASIDSERSFSADSDYPDILVVASRSVGNQKNKHAIFASLDHKPRSVLESYEIAKGILSTKDRSTLEGSITEGSPIEIGECRIGSTIKVKSKNLDEWNPVGIRQLALAQIAFHLSRGILKLPTSERVRRIPICNVREVATISKNSANITGSSSAPFRKTKLTANPAFPMLWNHQKSRELCLVVAPDSQGILKSGEENSAAEIWGLRSHAHFSRSTRTSQQLTACWTKKKVIGGRAWPNVKMHSKAAEAAFVIWSNTTLGLLLHWYTGNRSQVLLADHTVSSFPNTPTLDTRELDADQLKMASKILKQFSNKELAPMNRANEDDVRIELDRQVLVDMLRLPTTILSHLDLVRTWWCNEPHVRGS